MEKTSLCLSNTKRVGLVHPFILYITRGRVYLCTSNIRGAHPCTSHHEFILATLDTRWGSLALQMKEGSHSYISNERVLSLTEVRGSAYVNLAQGTC